MANASRRVTRRRAVAPAEETTEIVDEAWPPAPPLPPGQLPPEPELWPWMLVLLALVVAGLAAAYFATRDDEKTSKSATVTTTLSQRPTPVTTRPIANPKPTVSARAAVPKVVGMPAPAALQTLKKLALSGATRGAFYTTPRNRVVSQKPGIGSKLAKGAVVTLNVSKGPKAVSIPDVVGQDEIPAVSTVKAQGFVADVAKVPSDQPAGQVVAQHPVAGVNFTDVHDDRPASTSVGDRHGA